VIEEIRLVNNSAPEVESTFHQIVTKSDLKVSAEARVNQGRRKSARAMRFGFCATVESWREKTTFEVTGDHSLKRKSLPIHDIRIRGIFVPSFPR
jgi:hypothetical protein